MLKTLIVYHYVAHYRQPVFSALLDNAHAHGLEYTIAADTLSNIASLKLIDPESLTSAHPRRWVTLRNAWLSKNTLWQRGLVSLIWRERPDAVIFLGDAHFLSTWVAAAIARLRGTTVLMWTHGLLRSETGWKLAVRMAFYSLADTLLVYGARAKQLLANAGYPEDRIDVIFNSLDHGKQTIVRNELLAEPSQSVRARVLGRRDGAVLLFVGRLDPSKRLELLLRAVARLANARPDIRLVCVGDGPSRQSLEQLARELRVDDRVSFLGSCYDEHRLGELFYSADLSVSPGPVGLFAVHSLTYGTPVIISDNADKNGPEAEVVTVGATGNVFRDGSEEDLACCILTSLETLKKPNVIQECCQAVDGRYTPLAQTALINAAVKRSHSARNNG
jgi:glycosyltransferase involved in cell wall biosynthesis